jgi:hypothetical protein
MNSAVVWNDENQGVVLHLLRETIAKLGNYFLIQMKVD